MLETRLRNTTSAYPATASSGTGGTTDTAGLMRLNQTTTQTTVGTFAFPAVQVYGLSDTRIVYSATNGTLSDDNGLLWNSSTKQLTVNRNAAPAGAPTITGTSIRVNGADNESLRVGLTSFGPGGSNGYSVRSARGTGASPTATQENDLLGQFDGYGRSTTGWTITPKAIIKFSASENYSDTTQGAYIGFWVTSSGTIVPYEAMRINHNKSVKFYDGVALQTAQFEINPTVGASSAGKLYWDKTKSTLALNLNTEANLQIGQESVNYVVAGEDISNGQAVYFSSGSSNYPIAMKAIANADEKARVKGIATETIYAGSLGFVTNFGIINDINTAAFTSGDLVYLSAGTAGVLTNTVPIPPNQQIVVGRVLFSNSSSGSIYRSASPNYPISSDQIDLQRISGSSKHSLQDLFNTWGVGKVAGGTLSDAGSQQIAVTSGNCIVALGTLDTDPVVFANFGAKVASAISDQRVTWFAVQYLGNTAGIIALEGSSATDYAVPTAINYQNVFPLGYATRNGTEIYVTNNPRRMQDALGGLTARFYQTQPLARDERLGGLILGEQGGRFITLSAGKLWDRQNQFPISAVATTSGSVFSTWYRDSSTGFIETENVTQWPNTQYDNGSGTLQTVAANRYANLWWYLSTESSLSMVYGRAIYTSVALAANGPVPATLPLPINTHYKLIGRTTFQGSAASFAANDSIFTNQFNPSAVSTHNNLGGLQGGAASEYYHLTANEYAGSGSGIFVRQNSSFLSTVTLESGTTAASKAPVYFKAGTLMTTPEVGALEFTGNGLFITFL